jgi:hypothetical protein
LKFPFQTIPQPRQLLLARRFGLFPQCVLDPAPFLEITLLKLVPLFPFQAQAGIAQGRVDFNSNSLAVHAFSFAQNFSLLRSHLHPTLGVPAKYLSIFRRHRDPSIAWII